MIERRYVVEYVMNKFPERVYTHFNMRLGPPPSELAKKYPNMNPRWFKVWQPFADAIVVTRDTLWVIEAKVRNPTGAIGQLKRYILSVYETPELKPYLDRPVKGLLVMPLRHPIIERFALLEGIYVDYYCPRWVEDYLREVGVIP